jgi:hypothetical protein
MTPGLSSPAQRCGSGTSTAGLTPGTAGRERSARPDVRVGTPAARPRTGGADGRVDRERDQLPQGGTRVWVSSPRAPGAWPRPSGRTPAQGRDANGRADGARAALGHPRARRARPLSGRGPRPGRSWRLERVRRGSAPACRSARRSVAASGATVTETRNRTAAPTGRAHHAVHLPGGSSAAQVFPSSTMSSPETREGPPVLGVRLPPRPCGNRQAVGAVRLASHP